MWDNILRVDWAQLSHAYGHARDVPKILHKIISPEEKTRGEGWNAFWGVVNHQGDFYDSTNLHKGREENGVPCPDPEARPVELVAAED